MNDDVLQLPPRRRGLTGVVGRSTSTGLALVLLTSILTGLPAAAAPACTSGVAGDVNGDGHAELAIGVPGNNLDAGAVHLVYGTGSGLVTDASGTARDDQYLTQDTAGVPGTAETEDLFGYSTLLADFDGDGCADLAVGSPGENRARGSLTIVYGSPAGLSTSRVQSWTENALLGAGSARAEEFFGGALATGDLDDDGIADLVVGAPAEEIGGQSGGAAVMLLGSPTGLGGRPGTTTVLSQATPGVPGAPEDGDSFGAALAVGDFDGNGVHDLAVGVPGENGTLPEPGSGQGAVVLLPGSSTGLTGTRGQLVTQNSPGLDGIAGEDDRFGYALAMGRFDNGRLADLAIGTPRDSVGAVREAGSVSFLLGSREGLSTEGPGGSRFHQDVQGLSGTPEREDAFGSALAAAAIQTSSQENLVVGVPGEDVGSPADGMVHQLATFEYGPNTIGSRTLHEDTPGLRGVPGAGDLFGYELG